jgi:hypothetical protein
MWDVRRGMWEMGRGTWERQKEEDVGKAGAKPREKAGAPSGGFAATSPCWGLRDLWQVKTKRSVVPPAVAIPPRRPNTNCSQGGGAMPPIRLYDARISSPG